MRDFYEPTLLFRNNAIRRYSPELSPIASMESLPLSLRDNNGSSWNLNPSLNGSSWLLNPSTDKDNEVLNQSCSLNRLNIKSNYWKIPDNNMNLTCMSITNQRDENPTLAISSANNDSNLFIYELDLVDNYLTHHNTISLPNIHGMKWLPSDSRYLVTGNNKGYAHLISIPTSESFVEGDEEASAEICKRFNHKKHLRNKTDTEKNSSISKLNFMGPNQMLSLYSNHLFYWDVRNSDSQSKPSPVSISTIPGIMNFDPISGSSSNVGICGRFGVSLFDLRQPKFNVPPSVTREASKRKLGSNLMKWSPTNSNVFAASHGDGVVRLWDIRKQDSFTNLHGHQDRITSIEWNNGDIFTGSRDGNIIHWDLTTDMAASNSTTLKCGLKEGLTSVNFNPVTNSLEDTINQRQCGTVLPASNTNIIGMCSVQSSEDPEDLKVLSIDGSSFFGVHSKIYNAVNININSDKVYYSEEDMQLLLSSKEQSSSTLVDSEVESVHDTKPLIIRRNTVRAKEMPGGVGRVVDNVSCETLLDEDPTVVPAKTEDQIPDSPMTTDFNFTPAHGSGSIFSVDSQPLDSSPESRLFNDSMDTLSTHDSSIQTDEEIQGLTHKRDQSFTFAPHEFHHKRDLSLTPFIMDDLSFLRMDEVPYN